MTEPLRAVLRRRLLAVAGVAALALTTCTGSEEPRHTAVQTTGAASETVAAPVPDIVVPAIPSLEPPAEIEAAPAPAPGGDEDLVTAGGPPPPAAVELPEEVELLTPLVIVHGDGDPLASEALSEVAADETVATAAVTAFDLDATGPSGESGELQAMQVGLDDFRRFTPDVTAQNVGVWERLADGDVVVRHDVAHELDLELGGTITLRTPHGTVPARVGALAANGAPPFADLLVPEELGELLGAGAANTLIAGGTDAAEAERLAQRLADTLDARAEVIEPPETQQASAKSTGRVTLEPFTYRSRGDGTIAIDGDWVADNIVAVEIPGMGTTRCHRVMVPQLRAALHEVAEAGLYSHFDPNQFAGCFMPRHILWNPQRGLSMHAWGLAIDFNARDNGYGATPRMDLRIVEIFEKWGFSWGGWWRTPDGMHFQLERVVEVG